jgi:hypothetical protein
VRGGDRETTIALAYEYAPCEGLPEGKIIATLFQGGGEGEING